MIPEKPHLEEGKTYFVCMYYLEKLPVPAIETWIYVGSSKSDENNGENDLVHYFERPEAHYKEEIAMENAKVCPPSDESRQGEEIPKMRIADSELEALVYDYEGLKEWVFSLGAEPNAEKVF